MPSRILGRWRAAALAAPSLALLLIPLASQARDPVEATKRTSDAATGVQDFPGENNRAGLHSPIYGDTETNNGMGMPVRRVQPDESRMKQISGRVVKLNGQVLYVEREGAVVPLDLSALQVIKAPEKGQEVVAVYQVENRTENVALALSGEVKEPG